ncbi:MAG: VWA domain-containing protein [Candidatus Marinimicrobia bacterium]|nr:VWA domain-containing protein [Candidatus Neomarinimicrobiota bacterium]MCF7850690.1 VWA domain-containing protein [Candidatus Neomarinimicrobiota bacterium]
MIRFETFSAIIQWALWLMLPGLVVLGLWARASRRKLVSRAGDPELIEQLSHSVSKQKRRIKDTLRFCAIILVLIGVFGPKFSDELTEVKRQGVDVVVLLDVSNSMRAQDIKPDRLEKARFELRRLLKSLRGDRIALVVFAGQAHLQTPLTLDYSAFEMFLDISDESLIGVQGTSFSDAISIGMDAFDPKDTQHRAMIIISDGEDHEGNLEAVLSQAREENIIIHTAGVGTFSGTPIPIVDDRGEVTGYRKTATGETVTTRLYAATLQEISEETGGRFVHLNTASASLDEIYGDILGMEQKELSRHEYTNYKEQYHWFIWIALILLVLELLITDLHGTERNWQGEYIEN